MDSNITYRQKNKGWQYIISYKDPSGKWKQKSKQGFKTKKDAKEAAEKGLSVLKLDIKRKNQNASTLCEDTDITLKCVSEKCIEHLKIYTEPGTVTIQVVGIRKFEKLYDKKIPDIRKADIQEQIDHFIKDRHLKESTIKSYVLCLKRVFKYYKENYDESYEPPVKNLVYPKKIDIEKTALTKNELNELLNYFEHGNLKREYIVCLIAGTCGLRYSEIMGLTWNDIDFNKGMLDVNKQWKRNADGIWTFGILKSKNSKRLIPIPARTLKALKEYHQSYPTNINNKVFIEKSETIRVNLHYNLAKKFNISIHELRHTYATLLISNGIDFKTAAEYLGDDVQQIIKTYSHVTDDMRKSATEKILKIF